MKIQIKQLSLFFCALAFTPSIAFSLCQEKPVYVEPPKMEWHLDKCGQWHQGYDWSEDEYDQIQ